MAGGWLFKGMKIEELKEILLAQMIVDGRDKGANFEAVLACDMMSELLAIMNSTGHKEGLVLLTGLVNPQVIRTADLLDIDLIVFVRGKVPPQETVALARECGITLLSTPFTMYRGCGLLYERNLKDIGTKLNAA